MTIGSQSEEIKDLYKMALLVREKAYSPYSQYKVGAAIRTSTGKIYTGCNVENSSFGATCCAERVAIYKAVSEEGSCKLKEVMVVTKANPPWPPCGMCRQVMAEFGKDITVYSANLEGAFEKYTLGEIFAHAFTPEQL